MTLQEEWAAECRKLRNRRYHVERIVHWSKDRVIGDMGILSGEYLLKNLDCDRYGDEEKWDSTKLKNLLLDETMTGSLVGWPGEEICWIKITRVPCTTPITDNRGWFDKILHFIFRVKHQS